MCVGEKIHVNLHDNELSVIKLSACMTCLSLGTCLQLQWIPFTIKQEKVANAKQLTTNEKLNEYINKKITNVHINGNGNNTAILYFRLFYWCCF